MNLKTNFNRSDGFKLCVFIIVFGLATFYSKSISNYLVESYNSKIEFLANNSIKASHKIGY